MSEPFDETAAAEADRCPNRKCGRVLDAESLFASRCRHCKVVLAGNQISRKHPRPPNENDPQIALRLAELRLQKIHDRGGRDQLSSNLLDAIDRLVVMGLFLQSWEEYFLRAGLVTRQGRPRSGYQSYIATVTTYMRLLQLVGLDRVERPVNETPIEWLERRARERDGGTATTDIHDHPPDAAKEG